MTIPNATLLAIENLTDYSFHKTDNVWLALQAAGPNPFRIGGRTVGTDGNKRLALVGDAVIALVIKTKWFEDDEVLDRGERLYSMVLV